MLLQLKGSAEDPRQVADLFGNAEAGPSSGVGGGARDDHAWEWNNPWAWYRQDQQRQRQEREPETEEEGEEAGTGMTVARALEVLSLPQAEINRPMVSKAYRDAAKQCHPDKRAQHNLSNEEATARMQEVVEAKDVLMREIAAEQDLG